MGKEDSQAKATDPALGHGVWMGGGAGRERGGWTGVQGLSLKPYVRLRHLDLHEQDMLTKTLACALNQWTFSELH